MKTITVTTSHAYEVKIGEGLLKNLAQEVSSVTRATTFCVVSDSNVFALYGSTVYDCLEEAGFRCIRFVFPAGEQSKCARTWLELLEFLAQNRLTRSDCLIALGGGVVGDLTGFAAATYLRGIDYIQIPTTLLS